MMVEELAELVIANIEFLEWIPIPTKQIHMAHDDYALFFMKTMNTLQHPWSNILIQGQSPVMITPRTKWILLVKS